MDFAEPLSPALDEYLRAVMACPSLTREEEEELAARIKAGEEAAISPLVRANLRYVAEIAKRYCGRGTTFMELIDLGNIGLMRAASHCRSPIGYHFISFAVRHIRRAIVLGLDGRLHSTRSLSVSAGLSDSDWWTGLCRDAQREVLSSSPLRPAGSTDQEYPLSQTRTVEELFGLLDPTLAQVCRLYFGLAGKGPLTMEEIGVQLGWSVEAVREAIDEALRLLRHLEIRENPPDDCADNSVA